MLWSEDVDPTFRAQRNLENDCRLVASRSRIVELYELESVESDTLLYLL